MSLWNFSVHFFTRNKLLNNVILAVMQDMKSYPGLCRQMRHSTRRELFSLAPYLNWRKKHLEHSLVWCWHTGALWIIDEIYLGILETYCWRRLEEIVGAYRVKNYVLYRVKKKDNLLNTIKRRRGKCICHILCTNCHLRHIIKGQIEGTRRQGKRRMSYWMTLGKRENTGS